MKASTQSALITVCLSVCGYQAQALKQEGGTAIDSTTQTALPAKKKTVPDPVQEVETRLETNARVVCLKKRRTGTRIVQQRCQSVAEWRMEMHREYIRRYLLEMY